MTLPEDELEPAEAVEAMIKAAMARMSTAFLAEVLSVHERGKSVRVQPVNRVRLGSKWVRAAPIARVPVAFLGGAGAEVRGTLRKGDRVLCLCVDRSMDQWLQAGGSDITPSTRRRHSMTDAVVITRLEPFSTDTPELEEGDVALGQRTAQDPSRVLAGPSGVSIKGGGHELVQVLFDLLALLETTTVTTVAGPQPLSSVVGLGEIKTKIQAIGRGVS